MKGPSHAGRFGPFLLVAGGLLILSAVLIWVLQGSGNQRITPPEVGKPLPAFTLTDLQGNSVRLSDYAGRPVLINAWATWCPPCRAEMPLLEQVYQTYRERGLVVLAVNDGEDPGLAAEFVRQIGITFPVLLDAGSRYLISLNINDLPTSVLVGADGRVQAIHIGQMLAQTFEAEFAPYLTKP